MKRIGSENASDDWFPPLVVDVDGSLVKGDLLIEGLARMLAESPLTLLATPLMLVKGRAAFKRWVAASAQLAPATLALNPAVLAEIDHAQAQGREVWLASGADETAVGPLAEALGATGFLGSDGHTNLTGRAKAAALVERFGEAGFDYAGNERRDLAVWRHARRAIGVGLSTRLAHDVRALDGEARFLPGTESSPIDYLLALRPHQWLKNLLVFVPLVAAQEAAAAPYLVATGVFAALSAVASGMYLLNDLLDLPHDRQSGTKRDRPMAAGSLPLRPAIGLAALTVAGGLSASFWLSWMSGLCVLIYLVGSLAYSLWLKRLICADVVALALLYVTRVLAGAAAVSIVPSAWLLAFSLFVFLALAIVKRQVELRAALEHGARAPNGRAYLPEDLPVMTALGAANGIASVVVLALYLQSPEMSGRYDRPELLWSICPLLLYWLGRMTLLASRGQVDADPVAFAMRDRASWLIGTGILTAFLTAL